MSVGHHEKERFEMIAIKGRFLQSLIQMSFAWFFGFDDGERSIWTFDGSMTMS
jgi:hypothetical protein